MKFGKRQIVLGALILALGAAVYLNWQFTEAVPQKVDSTSVDAPVDKKISDENLGIAQLVNNSYVETVNDEMPVDAGTANDVMTDARITRQNARDEALDLLKDVLADVDADSEAKKAAVDESAKIAQNMVMESTAENLLKAKGISDVVVYINGEECNAIVKDLGENTLIIQEILTQQTGLALSNIHIIEADTQS